MRHIRISFFALWALTASPIAAQSDTSAIDARVQNAVQMQQAGDYTGAAEVYRSVLKERPDDTATHVNLGVVLVKLGRFDEAIAEYQAADKLLPGDPRIALNLALAYQKSGRIREAQERLAKLHTAVPQENQVILLLADCDLQLGQDEQVIELLRPLEAQTPDDLGLAYMLGTALLHEKRIAEGQAYLDRILRNGDTPEARFLLGTRMFESGDYPAAVKQFASAAELNPHLQRLQSFYGQALLNTGDPDAAAQAFRQELTENPADFDANLGLAQILTARKDYRNALPILKRTLPMRPASPAVQLALSECLAGSQQFREARPYAEAAVHALPKSPEAHQNLAVIYSGLHLNAASARERNAAQALASAADPGPQVAQLAPDFELADAVSGKPVRLHDFRGKRPVVLIFGSYTCPNFRASATALRNMQQRYGAQAAFLLVYIREAHSTSDWQSTRNTPETATVAPSVNFTEKTEHASMCSRELHLPFPAVVDGLNDAVEKAYNGWPSRAFIIARDGRIAYTTRLTELDFHAEDMEQVLRQVTARFTS